MVSKQELIEVNKKYDHDDSIIGRTILTFGGTMSSARGILYTSQIEQSEVLLRPEKPRVFTGYEKEFGSYSNAYLKTEDEYEVISKISKFPSLPNQNYILVVRDSKGQFDIIHKVSYEELSENYCYKYNTEAIDSFEEGNIIPKDKVLYKSTSFDDYMNWSFGINLRTLYLCDVRTTEDAFLISKSAAAKFTSPKHDKVEVVINDNDLLLNLYGNTDEYQAFPKIGDKIVNKKVCAKRRIVNDEILFSLTSDRLREPTDEDDIYVAHDGAVLMDINIYCNKDIQSMLDQFDIMTPENPNYQLYEAFANQVRYYREIVEKLTGIINQYGRENCSSDLKYELKRAEELLSGYKFIKNENIYSNMVVEFKLLAEHNLISGSKMVGRYGDKGVISQIVDDEDMPHVKLIDGSIVPVDIIANTFGVPNRTNLGQLFEVELNMRSDQYIATCKARGYDEMTIFKLFIDVVSTVNPQQAKKIQKLLKKWNKGDVIGFVQDIMDKGYFPIRQAPFWDSVGLDLLELLDDYMEKNWDIHIVKYDMYMNAFGRRIKAKRQVCCGSKYFLKLKHCPESKFSARSTGFINPRGLPNKSRTNKQNKSLYSNTPVRFGNQEIMLFMIGNGDKRIIHKMLMLHSSSIIGRRAVGELLDMNILDPYIELPEEATDRNTEILKMFLRTMGLELTCEPGDVNPFYMGDDDELNHLDYSDDYNKDLYKLPVNVYTDEVHKVYEEVKDKICVVKQHYVQDPENKGYYKLMRQGRIVDMSVEDYIRGRGSAPEPVVDDDFDEDED